MKDPTIRHWFKEFHDHRNGICDLEADPEADFCQSCCYRTIWSAAPNLCSCNLCSGRIGRRYGYRQTRAQWRGIRQKLLKTAPEDLDDVHVFISPSSYWG